MNGFSTRFTEKTGITIRKIGPWHWQHLDWNDGEPRQVGPIYQTKAEALADHESYLIRAGWMRSGEMA